MYSLNSDFINHAKIVEPLLMKWVDKAKQIRFNVKVSPIKELVINSFVIASNIYRELFGKDSYTAMNNITSSGHAYYGKRVELIELFGDDKSRESSHSTMLNSSKSFVNCLIPQITISDQTTNKLTEFAKELMRLRQSTQLTGSTSLTSNPLYLLGDIVNDQYITSIINRINALTYLVAIHTTKIEKIRRDLTNEFEYVFYANNINIDNINAIDAYLANLE